MYKLLDVTLYYNGKWQISRNYLRVYKFNYSGFHGDLNETYAVGEVDEESKKLIRTTREALDAAIAMCKPGALFRDIGKVMSVPVPSPHL